MNIRMSVLLSLVLVFISSLVFAQKNHVIEFATIAPGGTPVKIINELNEEIRKLSDDRIRFRIHAGTQGDEGEIIQKMERFGRIHAAGLTGRGLGEILPAIRVLELPFLFNNYDEVDYIRDKLYDYFALEFEKKGYVLLGWAEVGFVYMVSKDRISTRQELKKAKMWTWSDDPLAEEMFDALDVDPVSLALTDALPALQYGMINAVYAHPYGIIMLQWGDRTNYMNMLPITYANGAVLIKKKKFDELEPDLQEILLKSSKKWFDELVKQTRIDNDEAMKILKEEKGIEFVPKPDGNNLQAFLDAGISVRNNLVGKLYSQKLLDQVLDYLEEFRKKQIRK